MAASISTGTTPAACDIIQPSLSTDNNNDCEPDFKVPFLLQQGTPMLKISKKKVKTLIFTLDADRGLVRWDSRKPDGGKILIENIREFRPTSSASSYRLQLKIAQSFEERWLTIIYTLPSASATSDSYKALHVVALTSDIFTLWLSTLTRLHTLRTSLLSPSSSSSLDARERIWERSMWRAADTGGKEKEGLFARLKGDVLGKGDEKLSFEEVRHLCKTLGVGLGRQSLDGLFKTVDTNQTGFLNFAQFRKFVKLLKARPEIDKLYRHLCASNSSSSKLTYAAFLSFIRTTQKVSATTLPDSKVKEIWDSLVEQGQGNEEAVMTIEALTAFLMSRANAVWFDPPSSSYSSPGGPPMIMTTPPTPTPSAGLVSKFSPDTPTIKRQPSPLSIQTQTPAAGEEEVGEDGEACTPTLVPPNAQPRALLITQDMSRPLSEYFISSSHNTYLIGHQLVGVSTVEGYVRALLAGCRSVELDIYDSSSNPQEPIVKHGKTLTSSVTVRTICMAIAKYAFVASPYPVIISAEVHCGVDGQEHIANIMKECFGDALVRAELKDGELVVVNPPRPLSLPSGRVVLHPSPTKEGVVQVDVLPSPEDLRGRVLLKAKNLYVSASGELEEKGVTVDTESSLTSTSTATESEGDGIKELKSDLKSELSKARDMVKKVRLRRNAKEDTSTSTATPATTTEVEKVKMSVHLTSLLVYTVGVKCRGFNKKESYAPSHVFSLSERTANKVIKNSCYDLIKHNRSHLVRIYPDGMRIGSTNYDPVRFWGAGCQLVALNWQTFDLGFMLNHAMFQRNAKAGYVLKPLALRTSDKALLGKKTKHLLRVTVISGQQLPCHSIAVDPYVEVSLHMPDASPPSCKTTSVKSNSFNPLWDETLVVPFEVSGGVGGGGKELCFVRFEVKDAGSGGVGMGVYCASLVCLQEGYRHLPLHDSQLSQYLFSTLFVRIEVEEVP